MPESVKDLKAFLAMTNHKPPSMPDFVAKDFIKVNRMSLYDCCMFWVVWLLRIVCVSVVMFLSWPLVLDLFEGLSIVY